MKTKKWMPYAYCKRRAEKITRWLLKTYDRYDTQASMVDALADLMHAARFANIDWQHVERIANDHFTAETFGGELAQENDKQNRLNG